MCGDEAVGMSRVDERKYTVIRIWMTGLVASVGLLAACGSDSGPTGGAGGSRRHREARRPRWQGRHGGRVAWGVPEALGG